MLTAEAFHALFESPEIRERNRDGWTDMAARHAAAGRPFRRVRVVEDPLTEYNRYMIYSGSRNVWAGEDIRYLARADANRLDLPDHDFWVLDSARLIEMRCTADGRPTGQDLITDLDVVAGHEQWIQRAFAVAMTSADYVAEDPTRAWPPVRLRATSKGD